MPNLPKVPSWPILGSIGFLQNPLTFFKENFLTVGDTFRYNIANRRLIGSRDPKWLEHTFVKNQKNYNKDFSMEQIGLALGKGLLTNSGESWFKQRRLAQPAFYKKRLDALTDVMEDLTDSHIELMRKTPKGSTVFIDKEMMTLTASIALKTLFGEELSDDLRKVQSDMAEIQEYLIKRIRNPLFIYYTHWDGSFKEFSKKLATSDTIIYDIIDKKKRDGADGNDLVSMLLQSKDADTGESMPDKQLRDELLTIYVAGHETSAYALSWTFYELMQHPEVYQKIREEVLSVMKDGKIGPEGLKELAYTRAVMNEGMRLHPPAYLVSRVAAEDDEIDGYQVRKGEVVLFSIIGLHTHEQLWEKPHQFKPERFLENSEAVRKYFHPFGAGPRMCIGNHFAMMEITLVLAKVCAALDFNLIKNQIIEAQPLITLKPKYGIQLEKV
jgi:cytochrome P450